MGVDVTHIIKHRPIDLDDDAACKTFCEEAAVALKKILKFKGKPDIHIEYPGEDPYFWVIRIPMSFEEDYDLEIRLLKDLWTVESYYHYHRILDPFDNFFLRREIYKVAKALGQDEAWHSAEYYTWNSAMELGESKEHTFSDWLKFVNDKYQKQIQDLNPQDWISGINSNDYEPIYHDTFDDFKHGDDQPLPRCSWADPHSAIYTSYHDTEWGKPCHDDRKLFEFLLLECFQAGLSWITILKKCRNFRNAFDDFDYEKIARYRQAKIEKLMADEGIIRHRQKIEAAITNAKVFISIRKEFGPFDAYLQTFTHGQIIYDHTSTTSSLSDALSKDLRRRGMKFVGSTTIHSFLQAIGAINSHQPGCFLYQNPQPCE